MAASVRGQKRRRSIEPLADEGAQVLGPSDNSFARLLAEHVASAKLSAATAHELLTTMNKSVPSFGYCAETHAECATFLRQCLAQAGRTPPQLDLVKDDNDWGKTGSMSSRDDIFAIYRVGAGQVHIGVLLSHALDRDSDDDESDGGECKTKESFDILVKETSEEAMKDRSAQGVFSHSDTEELLEMVVAGPSDGNVHVGTVDRERGDRLITQAGCQLSFDCVIATAIRQMAKKHHCLKALDRAFARKRGVPKEAKPLYEAFQAVAKTGPGSK
uniref:Uncharacterized protein n=1 Tax=Zooxanthella nutricula TaxID=1333877 RepID=A0A6U6NNL7_9DINO|mmetsp:Transcript_50609/g.153956  ORF Transcript_50609/g.153956 Transcript_50609/m.153956 type:complete len:273 (+) Transcript_50609:44-862(+)